MDYPIVSRLIGSVEEPLDLQIDHGVWSGKLPVTEVRYALEWVGNSTAGHWQVVQTLVVET